MLNVEWQDYYERHMELALKTRTEKNHEECQVADRELGILCKSEASPFEPTCSAACMEETKNVYKILVGNREGIFGGRRGNHIYIYEGDSINKVKDPSRV
jgi:hypothetical protein